jgi:hypothetical protein
MREKKKIYYSIRSRKNLVIILLTKYITLFYRNIYTNGNRKVGGGDGSIKRNCNGWFSPSAFTSYIRNPIQFISKILRIREVEEVEENIA